MKIRAFRTHALDLEAGIRLHTTYGAPNTVRRHIIVELETDEGLVGFGEAAPLPFFTGETPETVREILERHYLPLLTGRDPFELIAIHRALDVLAANSTARAAVDMALHDLQGKALGLPLYRLFGGPTAPTLRRTMALGIGEPDAVTREAVRRVESGYSTLKLKIGGEPDDDIERVTAVRAAVGSRARIRVDANGGYTYATALRVLKALEPLDLEAAEQPLPPWDFDGFRMLRRAVDVPLMADESLHTPQDALQLVGERLVDYLVIKLIKTGGLQRARKIAAIAEAAGVDCVVSTPFETVVGASAALNLAFGLSNTTEHSHDLPPLPIEEDRAEGTIFPPTGAGLGVTSLPDREASYEPEESAISHQPSATASQ